MAAFAVLPLLAAFWGITGAVRPGAHGSQGAPTILRRCSEGSEENCCICSRPGGGKCHNEANQPKPCCELWVSDCNQNEDQFRRGFSIDCNFQPFQRGLIDEYQIKDKCEKAECSDAVKAKVALMEKIRSHQQLWFKSGLVNPYQSNSKWTNRCACGEFNEQTRQCKVKGKSKEKPCCTMIAKDCKADDPWPKRFAQAVTEDQRLKQQGTEIQSLYQSCIDNCHKKYQELCIKDLQETQAGFAQKVAAELEKLGPPPSIYDRSYETYYRVADKMAQKEKEDRVQRIHAKILQDKYSQLVDLSGWNGGGVLDDPSQQCCKCATAYEFGDVWLGTTITSFCSASSCATHPKCAVSDGAFCGQHSAACPAE